MAGAGAKVAPLLAQVATGLLTSLTQPLRLAPLTHLAALVGHQCAWQARPLNQIARTKERRQPARPRRRLKHCATRHSIPVFALTSLGSLQRPPDFAHRRVHVQRAPLAACLNFSSKIQEEEKEEKLTG